MPLRGGPADKAGNRYELKWVVRQFLRLLANEITWIWIEPPGLEGERIEFRLERADGEIEAHQVKRQQSAKGVWTVGDLARTGVLNGLRQHGLEDGNRFHFIPTEAIKGLRELAERAKQAADYNAFERHFLSSETVWSSRSMDRRDVALFGPLITGLPST